MVPRCRRNGGFYLLVMTAVFFSTVNKGSNDKQAQKPGRKVKPASTKHKLRLK